MNRIFMEATRRESVWNAVFKSDSKENLQIVLKNEWVKKRWDLINPGLLQAQKRRRKSQRRKINRAVRCPICFQTRKMIRTAIFQPLAFQQQRSRMQVTEFLGFIVLFLVFRCSEFRSTIYEAKLWNVYQSIFQSLKCRSYFSMSIFFAGILFVFYLYLAIYLPWWKHVHDSWSVYCPVNPLRSVVCRM